MRYIREVSVQAPGTRNEHIVGVRYSDSPRGQLTFRNRASVVSDIDTGVASYRSLSPGGASAEVRSFHPIGRQPYIATVANGRENDNLLSLPRF